MYMGSINLSLFCQLAIFYIEASRFFHQFALLTELRLFN